MKLKQLRDLAKALPEMLASARIYQDGEHLADLPNGTLFIDLLEEKAAHWNSELIEGMWLYAGAD